ncbi:MAG: helix-turn-helix domain-containing protein [Burkholderiales bacterium]
MQALDTGLRRLSTLIELGPKPLLKTVAEHAGMAPPKAHRYLASFCRSGLVARDPATDGYRLGPLAASLGLAALRQVDVVETLIKAELAGQSPVPLAKALVRTGSNTAAGRQTAAPVPCGNVSRCLRRQPNSRLALMPCSIR